MKSGFIDERQFRLVLYAQSSSNVGFHRTRITDTLPPLPSTVPHRLVRVAEDDRHGATLESRAPLREEREQRKELLLGILGVLNSSMEKKKSQVS